MYIIVYDTLVHPVMTLITYILHLHLHDMLLHPVMILADGAHLPPWPTLLYMTH